MAGLRCGSSGCCELHKLYKFINELQYKILTGDTMIGERYKDRIKKNKGPKGRPSKINPDVCKIICDNIELGMPYKYAAEAAGVSYNTFLNWRAKGEKTKESKPPSKYNKNEELYVYFFDATVKAEAEGMKTNLELIRRAAYGGDDFKPDWKAAAFVLKNRHPKEFKETQTVDSKVEHSGGVSINLQMVDCSKKEE